VFSRFSEQQIAFVLRQAEERTSLAEVCRKTGISQATYYACRKKYGGLMPSAIKRLKQLEEENGKLKRIVAQRYRPCRCGCASTPNANGKVS
jgi:putative transposase